ncbi:MAG: putative lipid II flippase FtsW [Oligoflexales bacterium]|nr:putative lipid II flippase FtsW [Oligoflexales bacterium]
MEKNNEEPSQNYIPNYIALIWLTALLTLVGLLAIYSSSYLKADELYGNPIFFLKKQAIFVVIGFSLIAIALKTPFKWLELATLPLLIAALLLLLMIYIPGASVKVGGASRWLNFGGFRFQPAELAKIALVLFLAKNLSRKSHDVNSFKLGVLPNFLVPMLFAFLLMFQPDFGSTAILFIMTVLMLFVAGLSRFYIFSGLVIATAAAFTAVLVAPYRLKRLMSFVDPWSQIRDGGFQIIQSYVAFKNGGFLGVGLGESQQKLYFLPEAHTDFILSVIGEELGLLGLLAIFTMFFAILYIGFRVAFHQTLNYRKFLAFGLTCLLGVQAFLNIGVTMGLLPTKGLPLPFISSGSSSLISFFIVMALLIKLAKEMPGQQHAISRSA